MSFMWETETWNFTLEKKDHWLNTAGFSMMKTITAQCKQIYFNQIKEH
jgi:hypothetical protein